MMMGSFGNKQPAIMDTLGSSIGGHSIVNPSLSKSLCA